MAETTVEVTFKPDKTKAPLTELKDHIELVEALMDASVTAPAEVTVELGSDYDDDSRILVASWTV